MKYNFDKIIERRSTGCLKYDAMDQIFGTDNILPMWVADMDFEAPAFVIDALAERTRHGIFGYGMRDEAWYDALTGWIGRRNDWNIDREWLTFVPGVVAGYVFAIRALTNEGDGVVINPPVYPPFASQIVANDRKLINNPLVFRRTDDNQDGRYEIDFEGLDKALSQARVLLFCNPHNPTGRVFTREELERVGELCCKHDVFIVSDEIHSDVVFSPHRHIHIASLRPEFAERTVTLVSPSKTFNLAGLTSSAAIVADAAIRRRLLAEMDRYHVDCGNIFGTVAMTEAYRHGDEWLDQMIGYVRDNIVYINDFLASNMPEIKLVPSEGTYLAWFDCSGLGLDKEELRRFFVDDARVGVSFGATFGDEGCCFVRMVIGVPRQTLEQAMSQIHNAYLRLIAK